MHPNSFEMQTQCTFTLFNLLFSVVAYSIKRSTESVSWTSYNFMHKRSAATIMQLVPTCKYDVNGDCMPKKCSVNCG